MTATRDDSASTARRLHLVFDDAKTFLSEYARNLARGGAMLASRDAFDLREVVDIVLDAAFAGTKLVLPAEVVHAAGGSVAVQFLIGAPELRERLDPLRECAERDAAVAEEPEPGAAGDALAIDADAFDAAGFDLDLDASAAQVHDFEAIGDDDAAVDDGDGDPNDRTYRERAARAATRVPVEVKSSTGKSLRGRTRDVSHTGVLLSVDGEELPIGRDVQISLVHPATGEQLDVPGKVVRHLAGEGVVGAVAVALQPGERRSEVERFVSDIKKADAEAQRGGIRGPLEELGGASLLQMFAALSKRGTLTVSHGVEEGCVAFEQGMLLFAHVGSVSGVKALARILSWRDGFFEFRAHVEPHASSQPHIQMEAAILEAVQVLDEGNRLSSPQLAPGTRLEVARDRLETSGAPLGKVEQAVLELAAAGFTVRRILDVIPEDDASIRVAISALLGRGLLKQTDA